MCSVKVVAVSDIGLVLEASWPIEEGIVGVAAAIAVPVVVDAVADMDFRP